MAGLVATPTIAHAAETADVWCDLSPRVPRAVPGATVSVTVTCGNNGPDTGANSLLVYTYPAGTTVGPLPKGGWGPEGSGSLGTIADLASGSTTKYTFTIKVPASAAAGSALRQQIQVLPGTTDPNPGNDSVSGQLVVAPAPAPTTAVPSPTHAPGTARPTPTRTRPVSASPSPSVSRPGGAGGAATGSAAALTSADSGSPTSGAPAPDHRSGLTGPVLALALLLLGGVLILGTAVAAAVSRRRRAEALVSMAGP